MGLAVRTEKGNYFPVLACDTCNEPITDWHLAIAAHDLSTGEGIGPIHLYHKGECDPGRVGRREEHASGWFELDHYLPWLLWNHGWGKKAGDLEKDATLTIRVPEPL